MIVLDTNVLSALMLQSPDLAVVQWLDRQPRHSVWTTSITVFEVRFGLMTMPAGRRQEFLASAFEKLLSEMIEHRIATFDAAAAQQAATLMAARQSAGPPGELRDTMIAGIVLASCATLATRNVKHFGDLASAVVNPWDGLGR